MSHTPIGMRNADGTHQDINSTTPLPTTSTMAAADRLALDNANQGYVDAIAYTPSDSTNITAGRGIAIVATVAGNVSVRMASGTFVFPVPTGLTILPLGVTRVNVTNTTATATYTKLT